MAASDRLLVRTPPVPLVSWSPCAPLIWNQDFPTPLGGPSISTSPVPAPDFRFSSPQILLGLKEMTDVGLFSVKFNKCIAIRLEAVICDAPARSSVRYTVNHNGKAGCDRCTVLGRRLEGPVILEKTLPQPYYLNFRRLALSMYLLAHPKVHKSVVETARMELLNFMNEYEWCYGCEHLVYNVHLLQHLPDDVRAHGPLDSFSAFPFESYMRQIKDSVRSGFAVAKQAAQRYAERMSFSDRLQISGLTNTTPIGATDVSTKQVIMFNSSKITSCQPDNVVVVNGQPGLITDIKEDGLLKFRTFTDPRNYFEDPFPSTDIGIFRCSVHLPDDVRAHGPLDSFSAFPFESYMRQIKDSVRSGFAVAKQAAQRYAERMSFSDRLQISGLTNTTPIGATDVSTKQVIMFNSSKITSCQPDNVVVVNGQPCLITDIMEDGLLKFRTFTDPRNYFEDPFPSTDIGIFRCSVVSHEHTWISLKDTDCKCIAINCINYVVIIPLLHTVI
ncbi:unnamed protein product [Schistosoma margrebowiei]|uniref:Uncharacterized protein n=1 Tax=Schistosoma margrebowiei TaxID=48269 RepID=A0A183MRJ2_9TREM|nr:unnamed protein product [Schistosoma margrebowiei]